MRRHPRPLVPPPVGRPVRSAGLAVLLGLTACNPDGDVKLRDTDTAPADDTDEGSECPSFTVVTGPGPAAAAGPLDALTLEVHSDVWSGRTVTLTDAGSSGASLAAQVTAEVDGASLVFDGIEAAGVGILALSVDPGEGCPVEDPVAQVLVGASLTTEPVYLPGARVGSDYVAALPTEVVIAEAAPAGLAVAGAWVTGVPEASGAFLLDAAAWGDGDVVRRLRVHLPVLPADDADLPAPAFEPSEDGPYAVDSLALVIPSVVTSAGTLTNVAVRVAYPSDGAGGVADGVFAAVAFHHAAHDPATIYDRYTDLHDRLASHGLVVASVDGSDALSGVSQSWQNLWDLSTIQLALVEQLREAPGAALAGHVDGDRVFVSGHSRGGAASLISLWRDASLAGAFCYEPVSPIQTPKQDWSDPESNGDRPYPVRPILLFAGSLDADEPWPLVDTAYEQTVGPAVFVTLMGANHEDTLDADAPGWNTSASTIPVEARHDLDQRYAVAFLARFGALEQAAGDLSMEPLLFGPEALSSDLSDEGVAVHARRWLASTLDIDDFQGAADENLMGGPNTGSGLDQDGNEAPYDDGLAAAGRGSDVIEVIGDWAVARHLAWADPSAELALVLTPDGGAVDLTGRSTLALRVERDCPPPSYGSCPDVAADFEVVLVDAAGNEASVPISDGLGDLGILGRFWQDSLLPLDSFSGVDLSRVTEVALRFGGLGIAEGDVWVDDVRVE